MFLNPEENLLRLKYFRILIFFNVLGNLSEIVHPNKIQHATPQSKMSGLAHKMAQVPGMQKFLQSLANSFTCAIFT